MNPFPKIKNTVTSISVEFSKRGKPRIFLSYIKQSTVDYVDVSSENREAVISVTDFIDGIKIYDTKQNGTIARAPLINDSYEDIGNYKKKKIFEKIIKKIEEMGYRK